MLFIVVYRPPNSTTDFCHGPTKLIDYALSHYGEIIVAGDFNIDLLRKKKSNLSTIFSDAGFTQIIKTATRVNDNTLTPIDHIYTTHPNRIVQSFVPVYEMSDHFPVCFVHKFHGAKSPKGLHDEIIHDLENAPWSLLEVFDDVNEKLATWKLIFNDVSNCHIPIVKKTVKPKCLSPWINKEIMHLILLRDQFKSRAKSYILTRLMYKNLRNQVVKKIANAKAAHMRNEIMENMNNPKKLWKILKQVAPTKPRPTNFSFIKVNGQQISNPVGISNAFNEHFTNTQQTNISVTDCIDLNEQDARLVNFIKSHISEATVFHIPPITTQQVIEDLKSIPNNKATGLDGIGIKPLKLALNAIAPSITHICNSSIASGIFPNNFKQAKLTPVYKKDSVHDRNNYRPISILTIISKPLERHVAKSYLGYLTSNNVIHRHQSAYRPHHSCETALLNLTDNWIKAMDSRKLVGSVLLDLSKAFDLVDLDLLLSKIDKYHVTNTSQEWFKSCLSN